MKDPSLASNRFPMTWIASLIVLLCCALFAKEAQGDLDDGIDEFDTTNVSAFVVYDSNMIVIEKDDKARFLLKTQIRVLREGGRKYARVEAFENSWTRCKKFSARVFNGEGREILSRTKKDLVKNCGFAEYFVLYSDICTYSTDLAAGSYPFTVEYELEYEFVSLFYWPEWSPQQDIPVRGSSYIIDSPDGYNYRYNSSRIDDSLPQSVQSDRGRRRVAWEAELVPPVYIEKLAPSEHEYCQWMDFVPNRTQLGKYAVQGDDWSSLGRSIYELTAEQSKIGPKAREFAESLLKPKIGLAEDVIDLHRELMSRQRYVAISIGIGGWQPHKADETFELKYGDCKDLSTLYSSLLSHRGVDARFALVRTKDLGQIDPHFPTISNFNHAIVMYTLGLDTIWVDPTCSVCDVSDLPESVEGIYALVCERSGGKLVRTPISNPAENLIVRRITIRLNEDLSAKLDFQIMTSGNHSHDWNYASKYLKTDDFKQFMLDQGLISTNMTIEKCSYSSSEPTLSRFSCEVSGTLRHAALKLGDRVQFRSTIVPSLFNLSGMNLESRRLPLELGYPACHSDTITILVPDLWKRVGLDQPVVATSEFGSIELSSLESADGFQLIRTQCLLKSRIEPIEFDSLQSFWEEFDRVLKTPVVYECSIE